MQKDLFNDEDLEPLYEVLEVRKELRNGHEIVTYVLTKGKFWKAQQKNAS